MPDSPLWNRRNSWQSQGKLYLFLVELNPILNDRIKTKQFLPAKPRLQYGQQWSAGNASDFLACILICLSEQSLGPAIGKRKWGWCWGCLKSILNDFQLPCFLCSLLYCTLSFIWFLSPQPHSHLLGFHRQRANVKQHRCKCFNGNAYYPADKHLYFPKTQFYCQTLGSAWRLDCQKEKN